MKRFIRIIIIMIYAVLSWGCKKAEWSGFREPVGTMYFHGVELREIGRQNWAKGGSYGVLAFNPGPRGCLSYYALNMANKSNTIKAQFKFILGSYEQIEDGYLFHYSRPSDGSDYYFSVTRLSLTEVYDIITVDVRLSNYRYDEEIHYTSFRIDYTMEVKDSWGITHTVKGWAITDEARFY